jgi:hypothetical protein
MDNITTDLAENKPGTFLLGRPSPYSSRNRYPLLFINGRQQDKPNCKQ